METLKIKLATKKQPPFDASLRDKLIEILKKGSETWNKWRKDNPDAYIDLREADLFSLFGEKSTTGEFFPLPDLNLSEANLSGANLAKLDIRGANLSSVYAAETIFQATKLNGADLSGAYMPACDFTFVKLDGADLRLSNLTSSSFFMASIERANLRGADISSSSIIDCSMADSIVAQVNFEDCNFRNSDLQRANLINTNFTGACLVDTNFKGADLNQCRIFGTSVWKTNLEETRQTNLIITPEGEPDVTVDNLKVAQFIYLILNNQEVRDVIETITSKVVLILGRFSEERKPILDALRIKLREYNYIPVMFDFQRPSNKSFIATIKTLASISRFVIADFTDARVVLQEVETILREYTYVPVLPLLLKGYTPPVVMLDYSDFDTFLDVHLYSDQESLLDEILECVITPAENKIEAISNRRLRLSSILFTN
jgi:uncharacterized protein YjbI with pentapeptide repeats